MSHMAVATPDCKRPTLLPRTHAPGTRAPWQVIALLIVARKVELISSMDFEQISSENSNSMLC